jgi:hypothetical protein
MLTNCQVLTNRIFSIFKFGFILASFFSLSTQPVSRQILFTLALGVETFLRSPLMKSIIKCFNEYQ